jgi:hypothetical protein
MNEEQLLAAVQKLREKYNEADIQMWLAHTTRGKYTSVKQIEDAVRRAKRPKSSLLNLALPFAQGALSGLTFGASDLAGVGAPQLAQAGALIPGGETDPNRLQETAQTQLDNVRADYPGAAAGAQLAGTLAGGALTGYGLLRGLQGIRRANNIKRAMSPYDAIGEVRAGKGSLIRMLMQKGISLEEATAIAEEEINAEVRRLTRQAVQGATPKGGLLAKYGPTAMKYAKRGVGAAVIEKMFHPARKIIGLLGGGER